MGRRTSLTICCYSKELGLIGELLLIVAAILLQFLQCLDNHYGKCASYLFGANAKFSLCFMFLQQFPQLSLDLVLNIVDGNTNNVKLSSTCAKGDARSETIFYFI